MASDLGLVAGTACTSAPGRRSPEFDDLRIAAKRDGQLCQRGAAECAALRVNLQPLRLRIPHRPGVGYVRTVDLHPTEPR